jgi:hypothetical protein
VKNGHDTLESLHPTHVGGRISTCCTGDTRGRRKHGCEHGMQNEELEEEEDLPVQRTKQRHVVGIGPEKV